MKKLLLSLSMFASVAMAQTILPDVITPEGWIHPLSKEKIDESAYMEAETGLSFSADGNALRVEVTATAAMSSGVKFFPFDATTATALQIPIDISESPKVYMKMKGTLGDFIRVDLKNGSNYDFVDGYPLRKQILCEDYRWYTFDFSSKAANTINDIREVYISHNPDVQGAGVFWIDSLMIGNVGFVPDMPAPVDSVRWDFDLTRDWYTEAKPENNLVLDSLSSYTATIGLAAASDAGVSFTIYGRNENTDQHEAYVLDIRKKPFVRTLVKGPVGDTLRAFFFEKLAYVYVDSYKTHVFTTNDFEEVIFDYSDLSASLLDEVVAVEFVLNPNSQVAGTLVFKELTIGDYEATGCPEAPQVGISDKKSTNSGIVIYPNPASAERVQFSEKLTNVAVYDALGNQLMKAKEANDIQISSLKSGMYIIQASEGAFKFVVE